MRGPAGYGLVIQTAVAASAAYFLANFVLGSKQPFSRLDCGGDLFRPDALGLTLGQHGRRVVEVVVRVAVGLKVADLLLLVISVGTVQIGVVVALAMVVFFAESSLLVTQAAISAILVIILQPPDIAFSPDRFVNALIGGAVALAVSRLFVVDLERVV